MEVHSKATPAHLSRSDGTAGIANDENRCTAEKMVRSTSCDNLAEGISLSSYKTEGIFERQCSDGAQLYLREWLLHGTIPEESALMLASSEAKCYMLERHRFRIDDDGVVWRLPDEKGDPDRLLVPDTLRDDVMHMCHDVPSAGHQGIQRSKQRLKTYFYWWRMSGDMKYYVLTCDVGNRHKRGAQQGRSGLRSYQASSPMERVHLDFLGPLPKTAKGNEYVLMMVDQFTKWIECIALPTQTAEETATAAVNEFFARFGYPFEIFTDQGRNFESELFRKVCDLLHIHKARTTPYRPQGNGECERQNRSLLDCVRCYIDKSPTSWDKHLGPLAGALRSSVNRQTGYTPNRLMLGREVHIPATLVYHPTPSASSQNREDNEDMVDNDNPEPEVNDNPDPVDQYVATLHERLTTAHTLARELLETAQKVMKRDYDLTLRQRHYKLGDVVYYVNNVRPKSGKNFFRRGQDRVSFVI